MTESDVADYAPPRGWPLPVERWDWQDLGDALWNRIERLGNATHRRRQRLKLIQIRNSARLQKLQDRPAVDMEEEMFPARTRCRACATDIGALVDAGVPAHRVAILYGVSEGTMREFLASDWYRELREG